MTTNDKKCICEPGVILGACESPHHLYNLPVEDKRECKHQFWKDRNPEQCMNCGKTEKELFNEKYQLKQEPQNQDWEKVFDEKFYYLIPSKGRENTIGTLNANEHINLKQFIAHLLLETEQRHDEELKNWIECNRCIECKKNKGVSVCIPCRNRFRDKAVSEVKRELAEEYEKYQELIMNVGMKHQARSGEG